MSPAKDSQPSVDKITKQVGSRIKELRLERDWSLEELSQHSGVSRSMLSQIEREQANPTLAVTLRIALAFELSLAELVEVPKPNSSIEVIRADDPKFHYRTDSDCQIRTLSPLHLEKDVEFYELRLSSEGELRSSAHYEGTREFLTVERGRVQIESGESLLELNKGDSVSYQADVPHAILNLGRGDALLFLVVIYK